MPATNYFRVTRQNTQTGKWHQAARDVFPFEDGDRDSVEDAYVGAKRAAQGSVVRLAVWRRPQHPGAWDVIPVVGVCPDDELPN